MKTSKQKLIKLLVAVLIVTGSVFSLGIKFYADGEVLSVDRPSIIKSGPDNTVSILIGNSIYVIDESGYTNNVFELDKLGFRVIGGHDYFSNGDLLLYSNNVEPNLLESLAQFLRFKETRNEPVSGTDGLYRCDIQTYDCQLFTTELPAMYSTFRVDIDRESDTVYLADTPRFVLYKLSSKGTLLAKYDKDLWFPNQLYLYDNNLYVADTNNHVIKVVRSDTEYFGEHVESHKVVIGGPYKWPTEIIRTPEHWWVGISDNNMDNGRIQVFDNNWNKSGSPLLDGSDTDARSMHLFGEQVWVADWTRIKIYRFNLSGERLSDFTNNEIEQAFADSHVLIKKYESLSTYGLAVFFVVFSLGLLAAYVLEKEETFNAFKLNHEFPDTDNVSVEDLKNPEGESVYWIESNFSKYNILVHVFFAVLLVLLGGSFFSLLKDVDSINWQLYFMMATVFPFFILIYWAWYRLTKVKIGISGHLLLVDDGKGHVGVGKAGRVRYNNRTLIVDDVIALLGQPHAPIYPKEELKQWVIPRMRLGELVDQKYIFKIMWQQKHPSIISIIGIVIYGAMVFLVTAV